MTIGVPNLTKGNGQSSYYRYIPCQCAKVFNGSRERS